MQLSISPGCLEKQTQSVPQQLVSLQEMTYWHCTWSSARTKVSGRSSWPFARLRKECYLLWSYIASARKKNWSWQLSRYFCHHEAWLMHSQMNNCWSVHCRSGSLAVAQTQIQIRAQRQWWKHWQFILRFPIHVRGKDPRETSRRLPFIGEIDLR